VASLKFPDTGTRLVVLPSGKPAIGVVGYLYADKTLTIPAEVYYDANGTKGDRIAALAIGGVPITLNAYGEQPDYWGPTDGTDRLYLVVNGVVSGVDADYNSRIDAVEIRTAALEPGGSAAATPATRTVSTTAPLSGGGDLSANRILGVSAATAGAVGVVQLAGDLTGTATSPTVAPGAITEPKTAAGLIGRLYAASSGVREVLANDPFFGTAGTRSAFINALDAAETLGKWTHVIIPAGVTIDVLGGLSMSGRSAQIKGRGAGVTGTTVAGSAIIASTQSGPVVDLTGYGDPTNFQGKVEPLSHLVIKGSGLADATKANAGIKAGSLSSVHLHDLAILGTGGPCINLAPSPGDAFYLSDLERIVLSGPVGAKINNVPWFYANECNGNRFRGIGLRSLLASADVGVSGAVVVEGNVTYPAYGNLFDAWWFEFLHPPAGGTIFNHAANLSTIRDFSWHDCRMEAGAAGSGTSFIRLTPPAAQDFGANLLLGDIPGDNGESNYIDTGVDVRQSRNVIVGTKNYKGKNVTLAAGVSRTYVHLGGGVSGASDPAFVDNSGSTDNHLVDEYAQSEIRPPAWTQVRATGTSSVHRSKLAADTTERFDVDASGKMAWGSGAAARDVNLYRKAANVLGTDDSVFLADQGAPPATPTAGGILFAQGGALKFVGSSGTVTTLAPA